MTIIITLILKEMSTLTPKTFRRLRQKEKDRGNKVTDINLLKYVLFCFVCLFVVVVIVFCFVFRH